VPDDQWPFGNIERAADQKGEGAARMMIPVKTPIASRLPRPLVDSDMPAKLVLLSQAGETSGAVNAYLRLVRQAT
jgi:hypothetical protein